MYVRGNVLNSVFPEHGKVTFEGFILKPEPPMSCENLTFTQSGVSPLEAGGEYLADIGEIEEEEGDSNHSVEDGEHFANRSLGNYMSVTCKANWLHFTPSPNEHSLKGGVILKYFNLSTSK